LVIRFDFKETLISAGIIDEHGALMIMDDWEEGPEYY